MKTRVKLICFLVSCIIIVFIKPFSTFVFFYPFFYEFLYVIFLVLRIWRSKYYRVVEVKYRNLDDLSNISIWFEIMRIKAFLRLYTILISRTVSLKSLFFPLILIFLGAPYRFLKLSYTLLVVHSSIRTGLRNIYSELYEKSRNHKIECIDYKIYLNCFLLKNLIRATIHRNPHFTKPEIKENLKSLWFHLKDITSFEKANDKRVNFVLANIMPLPNSVLIKSHFTQLISLNHFNVNGTVHSTSNTRNTLEVNQYTTAAFKNMITNYALYPGSVLTVDPYRIHIHKNTDRSITLWELKKCIHSINPDLLINFDEKEYCDERKLLISKILGLNNEEDKVLIDDIDMGNYDISLQFSDDYFSQEFDVVIQDRTVD